MYNRKDRSIQPNSSDKELGSFLDTVASDLAADKDLLVSGSHYSREGLINILIRPCQSKLTCRFPRFQFNVGFNLQDNYQIAIESVIQGILPKFRERWIKSQRKKLMGQKVLIATGVNLYYALLLT